MELKIKDVDLSKKNNSQNAILDFSMRNFQLTFSFKESYFQELSILDPMRWMHQVDYSLSMENVFCEKKLLMTAFFTVPRDEFGTDNPPIYILAHVVGGQNPFFRGHAQHPSFSVFPHASNTKSNQGCQMSQYVSLLTLLPYYFLY